MAREWRRHEVSELIANGQLVIGDGYRAKNEELSARGLPFARAGNIDGGFRFQDADHFPEENLPRVGNKVSQPGDVVFTSKGTVGRFAYVRPDTPRFVYSPQLCFWRSTDESAIRSRFLYYWMFSREFSVQFRGVAGQTDMAEYVSLGDQRRMHITLPPLTEQRAIAHILGTLDDKIELNRQMNETLEAMARAIFKSWLVDFDPVRAKAEGRQPVGMDTRVAALFPSAFTGMELGEMPAGWKAGSLGEVASNPRRVVDPGGVDPGTPYIGLEHMPRRSIALDAWGAADDVTSGKSRFRMDEILFGKLRPYFHKVGVAPFDGVCSTDILTISPKMPVWFGFVLGHVSSVELINYADACSTGTKMPRVNWSDLARYGVALPSPELAAVLNESIRPLVARITNNIMESRTLAALRDTLLPKLISGGLRIPDAEQIIGRSG